MRLWWAPQSPGCSCWLSGLLPMVAGDRARGWSPSPRSSLLSSLPLQSQEQWGRISCQEQSPVPFCRLLASSSYPLPPSSPAGTVLPSEAAVRTFEAPQTNLTLLSVLFRDPTALRGGRGGGGSLLWGSQPLPPRRQAAGTAPPGWCLSRDPAGQQSASSSPAGRRGRRERWLMPGGCAAPQPWHQHGSDRGTCPGHLKPSCRLPPAPLAASWQQLPRDQLSACPQPQPCPALGETWYPRGRGAGTRGSFRSLPALAVL